MKKITKYDLVNSIINFYRENYRINKIETFFEDQLILESNNENKVVIEKYYEFDVTISEYKNSNRIKVYQTDYADLPEEILEKILDSIKDVA